jgi:hypothetical protein
MNKRIKMLFVVFIAVVMIGGGSLSRGQSKQKLSVSKHGTLLEIFDGNGKSRFGKLRGEGFQLSYEFQGKTTSVSVLGDKVVGLGVRGVKTDRQSTTVTTTTSDQALEITTYFFVNEKTDKLIIQRKFKNISKEPVVVKTMLEYVDPAFVIGVGRKLNESGDKLLALMRNEMRGSMMLGDCIPECPDEPPPCPLPCPINVKLNPDQMTMKLNPTSDRPDTLILPADGAITVPPDGAAIQHLFVSLSAKN